VPETSFEFEPGDQASDDAVPHPHARLLSWRKRHDPSGGAGACDLAVRPRELGLHVVEPGLSAGAQHAPYLRYPGFRVGPVVEAEGRHNERHGLVGIRQLGNVGDPVPQPTGSRYSRVVACRRGAGAVDHLGRDVDALDLQVGAEAMQQARYPAGAGPDIDDEGTLVG